MVVKRIVMCGSALTEPGGMTSVCKQLVGHDWGGDFEIAYIPTHVSGGTFVKVRVFVCGLLKIRGELRSGRVGIVHIHMSYKGSFARKYRIYRLCRRYGVPCLLHMHGSEFKSFYEAASVGLKRRIAEMLEGSSVVVALGDVWRDFYRFIAPSANVVVLKNAVPFKGVGTRRRHEEFGVVFLGLLIERKGVADLVDGFASFSRGCASGARLYIAGAGDEEESLRRCARELGVSQAVEFLGWIDEDARRDLFSRCDVFALPSYNEGLPVSLLEAMSVGLPSVVSDVGSVSEAISDGVEGLLVEPGYPEQIASALARFYTDEDFWISCSRASMYRVQTEFDEKLYFTRLSEIYSSIYNRGVLN